MERATLPFVFGIAMAAAMLWGGFLGFINGYDAWYWVLALVTGIVGLTMFVISEESDTDWEPRRTFSRTSSTTIHFERPRRFHADDEME